MSTQNNGKNFLASYFMNDSSAYDQTNSAIDLAGRSFFDLISDCKNFNDRDSTEYNGDDYYDMWPPCSVDQSTSLDFSNRQFYFAIDEPLIDPIKQLVLKHYGANEAQKRMLPNSETVIADANGLQILIKCGCFRSVINLTYKILKEIVAKSLQASHLEDASRSNKTIYTPYSLQIWFIRIAILMKLKLFREAESELKQFDNFDRPEFFYDNHAKYYANRRGSMIAFGFRMLNAEMPYYLGRSDESIVNLIRLQKVATNIIGKLKNDSNALRIWNERKLKIQYSLANILLSKKMYEKALSVLEEISESDYADKCGVWSLIGKVYLQLGDTSSARNSFQSAKRFSNTENKIDECRNLINLSHLRISNSLYKEAYEFAREAHVLMPGNSMLVNNMAFCLFYSGHLREAISLIEQHINANPSKNLNETLVFNLCTLYELESSKAHQKKLTLLLWLNVYAGDGFYEQCIQLQ